MVTPILPRYMILVILSVILVNQVCYAQGLSEPYSTMFRSNAGGTCEYDTECLEAFNGIIRKHTLINHITDAPIIIDNILYCSTTDTKGKLIAINIGSGERIWEFLAEGYMETIPSYYDNIVFCGSSDHFIYALDANSGQLKWKFDMGIGPQTRSAIVINDGMIYITSLGNKLYCIDAKLGKMVWVHNIRSEITTSPVIINGKDIAFGDWDGVLYCINGITGEELWKVACEDMILDVLAIENTVYTGDFSGNIYAINGASKETIWQNGSFEEPDYFAASENILYLHDKGKLKAINSKNGDSIWSADSKISVYPAISDKIIYYSAFPNLMVAADKYTGNTIWQYEFDGRPLSPIVNNGMLYFGTQYKNAVYAIE
ncbi:MAG: PQQ-binding-like beta-propeller repeat protein [Candidatus Zixiibacteriota bacterium]